MPSEFELRKYQRELLFDFKKLELDNQKLDIKGLRELIVRHEAGMIDEDVALVEKRIAELFKKR